MKDGVCVAAAHVPVHMRFPPFDGHLP
jgi:hypothetical protein